MNVGPFRFAPPWWATLLALLLLAALVALGNWQRQRAQYKERLVARRQVANRISPASMTPGREPASGNERSGDLLYGARYVASGRYEGAHQILLTDQVSHNRVGYRVWTPLIVASGVRVMIDRGWVPRAQVDSGAAASKLAVPKGRVEVHGFWRSFPQPGLTMGQGSGCADRAWPRKLSFPDAASVRCQYHAPVANGLLLLSPDDANGFVRSWKTDLIGIRPWRHYAYAIQWFAMAIAVAVVFIVVNSGRRRSRDQ